jgi:methionine aminopeptidase
LLLLLPLLLLPLLLLCCSEVAKSFKGKQIDKGVAFPTCVSPNRCVAGGCVCASSRG